MVQKGNEKPQEKTEQLVFKYSRKATDGDREYTTLNRGKIKKK